MKEEFNNGPSSAEVSQDPTDTRCDNSFERPMIAAVPWNAALGRETDPDKIEQLPGDVCEQMRQMQSEIEFTPGVYDNGISAQSVLGLPDDHSERIDIYVGLQGDRAVVSRLETDELFRTTKGPGETLGTAHLARIHEIAAETAAQILEQGGVEMEALTEALTPALVQMACDRRIAELRELQLEATRLELKLVENDLADAKNGSTKEFDLAHQRDRLEESISHLIECGADLALPANGSNGSQD